MPKEDQYTKAAQRVEQEISDLKNEFADLHEAHTTEPELQNDETTFNILNMLAHTIYRLKGILKHLKAENDQSE